MGNRYRVGGSWGERCGRAVWVALVLLVALLTGVVAVAPAQQPQQPKKLSFASVEQGTLGYITSIAKGQKFDVKHGIDLEVKYFAISEGINALIFRKIELGYLPVIAAARANLRGRDLRLITPLMTSHFSVLVNTDDAAKGIADLKGRRLGILDRNTGMYADFAVNLKLSGYDFEKDFKVVTGAPQVYIGLLKRRELDAIVLFEPLVSKLLAAGWVRELENVDAMWKRQTGADYLFSVGIGAYGDWIEKNPDLTRAVQNMIADSIRYLWQHPEEAVRANTGILGLKTDAEVKTASARMALFYPQLWNAAMLENTKLAIKKNIELGFLPPQAATVMDDMFRSMPREVSYR